jgi:hypothetical protein
LRFQPLVIQVGSCPENWETAKIKLQKIVNSLEFPINRLEGGYTYRAAFRRN